MRTPRWLAGALLAGVVLVIGAACARTNDGGSVTGTGDSPNTPPATSVEVTVTRTGGIAGVNQTIEIASDGGWVYTDARKQSTESGTLTEAQRLELVRLASSADFFEQVTPYPYPTACADAFQYLISIDGRRQVSYSDCGRPGQESVQAALALISDATAF